MPLIHFLVCSTVASRVFFYFLSVWDQHWQGLVCKEKAGGQTEEAREEDGQAEAEGEAVWSHPVVPVFLWTFPHFFFSKCQLMLPLTLMCLFVASWKIVYPNDFVQSNDLS